MSLVKRSNGIYYQVTFLGGRRIWRSTRERTKSGARRSIKESIERAERKPDLSVSQFATHFWPHAHTNFAPTTVELYQAATRILIRILGDHLLRAYSAADVERLKTLRVAEVSPVRVNLEFRTAKAFFQTAVRWGFLEKNPFASVKQIRIPPRRPAYHSLMRDLVIVAVHTAMRLGEIIHLTWDQVNLAERFIHRPEFKLKSGQPRSPHVPEFRSMCSHLYLASSFPGDG